MTDRLVPRLDSGAAALERNLEAERRERELAALPVPPPSVAVGATLDVTQIGADPVQGLIDAAEIHARDLDDDGRWHETEGPGQAKTVLEADDEQRAYLAARKTDARGRAGKILELEASLKALALRSVEWHDERLRLLRTIDDLRAKRPRTVIGVAAQAGRGLLDVWGGR